MGQQITHANIICGTRPKKSRKTSVLASPPKPTRTRRLTKQRPTHPKSENRRTAVVLSRHGTRLRACESPHATTALDERLRLQRQQGAPPPSRPNHRPWGGPAALQRCSTLSSMLVYGYVLTTWLQPRGQQAAIIENRNSKCEHHI